MLAARLPGILPTLEPGEALELGMDPVDPGGHPLRLGPAVMTNTLGIAGSVCGGLLEFARGRGRDGQRHPHPNPPPLAGEGREGVAAYFYSRDIRRHLPLFEAISS
jgi:hypothetical protein